MPLLHQGRAIGALLVRRRRPGAFAPEIVSLLQAFASQSSLAIYNARLFREIEQKSEQLAVASQHKSQFLANMSHELRTPLNAILGYTELMQDGLYGDLPTKTKEVLDRVQKNGKHLLGLINDVLDLSKIEAGQLVLNLEEYSMKDVVLTVVSATESLASAKKLPLKVAVSDKMPLGRGDERRIAQVLLNLVGNAIKFTDDGEVRIAASVANGMFSVAVTDTGPGIPVAEQARIFHEFHQVDSSNTKKKGGTGLGLAIAKRIVELHGGKNLGEIRTRQGVDLPDRPPCQRRPPDGGRMSKRILVIEDQEDNRIILRDLLSSAGYELIEAADGEEGVKLAQQEKPDLILMDIQLPVIDGYEATRRIKANRRSQVDPDHRRDVVRLERGRSQGACRRLRRLRHQAVQPARSARQGARVLAG